MKTLYLAFMLSVLIYAKPLYTNALVNEHSLYLQQHAHNPVNWYPWGEEAFIKAKKENKLIFVSLGYSTCHWCHVMEKESFTDIEVSKLLNENYISVKVDREEYPQLDRLYQRLYIAMNHKRGGWPLSVFLSPNAEVIHIATYIPKLEAYGSIGMMQMLPALLKFQQDKPNFKKGIQEYALAQENINENVVLSAPLEEKIIEKSMSALAEQFDEKNGGFANRPKFPEVSKIELLLDIYELTGDKKAQLMAEVTLKKMAEGGIYDQINGGFFRYTTDESWHIPHFEKMLYTNGEIIPQYARLYQQTTNPLYKKIIIETISHIEKKFMHKGLYLSASDADSNGEEGGYFIYEYVEVKKYLLQKGWSLKDVEEVLAYLGIEEDGNIDGDFSHTHITSQVKPKKLEEAKQYLRSISSKRSYPFIDKKIITGWNAMMIKGLFSAASIDKKYMSMGEKRLKSLLDAMLKKDILYHQTVLGYKPKQKALLEDYAFLIDTLIEAYSCTYKEKYLILAQTLAAKSLKKFYRNKRWYLSNDGMGVYADFDDRYYTSGLSMMLDNLIRLASLSYELKYIKIVKDSISNTAGILEKHPEKVSKLVHTYLRLNQGDIIFKSELTKLEKNRKKINDFSYPFTLTMPEKSDKYLACRVNSCFAHDDDLNKLLLKVKETITK